MVGPIKRKDPTAPQQPPTPGWDCHPTSLRTGCGAGGGGTHPRSSRGAPRPWGSTGAGRAHPRRDTTAHKHQGAAAAPPALSPSQGSIQTTRNGTQDQQGRRSQTRRCGMSEAPGLANSRFFCISFHFLTRASTEKLFCYFAD